MIHLNYDGKQNNGIIFNDTYANGAMYRGSHLKPTLTFEYDSFQYSEVFLDVLDYVQLGNVKTVMTQAQADEIKLVATSWVQELGQEGNPNDEQKVTMIKSAVQAYLDTEALKLGFDNINSIAKFLGFDNRYLVDATALRDKMVATWGYVEDELTKMELGQRTIPTSDEAVAEVIAQGF